MTYVNALGLFQKCYRHLVGNPEGKRRGRRHGSRRQNIELHFKLIGFEIVELIHVIEDRETWKLLLDIAMSF